MMSGNSVLVSKTELGTIVTTGSGGKLIPSKVSGSESTCVGGRASSRIIMYTPFAVGALRDGLSCCSDVAFRKLGILYVLGRIREVRVGTSCGSTR